MKNYQITITGTDVPYLIEAIGLRALSLQRSIQMQVEEIEAKARQAIEQPKTITIAAEPIVVPKEAKVEAPEPKEKISRKAKRAILMRILRAKGAEDLSTAEIARRAGVSYVTAMKARHAFAKPAKKGKK